MSLSYTCTTLSVCRLKWNAPGDLKMYIYFFMDLKRIINYVVVVVGGGDIIPNHFNKIKVKQNIN